MLHGRGKNSTTPARNPGSRPPCATGADRWRATMLQHNWSRVQSACAVSLWLMAGSAAAQANPELGDVSASGSTTQTTTTTVQTRPVGTPASPPPAASTTTTTTDSTTTTVSNRWPDTDHGSVVGHFGVGFFGVLAVPVAGAGNTAAAFTETVAAPSIGVRWWMQDWLGIEAA